MRKQQVAVIGPGASCKEEIKQSAYELGTLLDPVTMRLLSGGRNVGVMDAVSRGAKAAGVEVIGILPNQGEEGVTEHLDVQINTDLGSARNNVLVLSADAIVAFEGEGGTLSEVGLALKAKKPIAMVTPSKKFHQLVEANKYKILITSTVSETLDWLKGLQ